MKKTLKNAPDMQVYTENLEKLSNPVTQGEAQRKAMVKEKEDHIICPLKAQVKLKLQNEKKIGKQKAELKTLSREKDSKVSKAEKDIITEQYKSIFKYITTLSNLATLMQQEMTKLNELRNTIASLQDEKKKKKTKLISAESQLLAKM
eukprot:m51a1_g10186 hypothetical protein (148) ;mRNA; f:95225-96620